MPRRAHHALVPDRRVERAARGGAHREARGLAHRHGVDPENPQTFILIDGDRAYFRSDAALRIIARLPGWRWTAALRAIPPTMRDRVYDLVARNRYRWFGRLDTCVVPAPPRRHER